MVWYECPVKGRVTRKECERCHKKKPRYVTRALCVREQKAVKSTEQPNEEKRS